LPRIRPIFDFNQSQNVSSRLRSLDHCLIQS